jgi:hypothetical protein
MFKIEQAALDKGFSLILLLERCLRGFSSSDNKLKLD